MVKKFLPLLRKAAEVNAGLPAGCDRAAVLNVGSLISSYDNTLNSTGYKMHYRASKAALNSLTLSLARQLQDSGILFLVINPGKFGGAGSSSGPVFRSGD